MQLRQMMVVVLAVGLCLGGEAILSSSVSWAGGKNSYCYQTCRKSLTSRLERYRKVIRPRRRARCLKMALRAKAFCKKPNKNGVTHCKAVLTKRLAGCAEVEKRRKGLCQARIAEVVKKIPTFCKKSCKGSKSCLKKCPKQRAKFYKDWLAFCVSRTARKARGCKNFAQTRYQLCLAGLSRDGKKCGRYARGVAKECLANNKKRGNIHEKELHYLLTRCLKHCTYGAKAPR